MSLSKEERRHLSHLPLQHHIREKIYRNIPTAHPSKHLFRPGVATNREASIIDHFANVGSLVDYGEPQKNRSFQYGDNEDTSFCFDAVIVPTTRFSDGNSVWYASDGLDTSKSEVIYHLKRQAAKELANTKREEFIDFERVVFEANISFEGIDLTQQTSALPGLMENGPPYPYCSAIGGVLHALGCQGLIFTSVRHAGGINYGVFEKEAVLSSKAICYFPVRIFKNGRVEVCEEEFSS